MAYTVLARRYRPQTFQEVVGQEPIALTLRRAIESGRVAHAYLFAGTRGIGKTSMARILAAALNCKNGPTAEPCGTCDICQSIHRGDDVDVLEIDGASNTSVEDVRTLRENAHYRPARARYKIYYIDEVHMLSRSAFNALLKTLEEPPEHILFLFSTTEPERLPATVLSRCQRLDFRAVPTERIAEHLAAISKKEKVKADPAALLAVAREGRGSVRDALTLLDQVIAVGGGEVTLEAVRQTVGAVSGDRVLALVTACSEGQVGQGLRLFGTLLASGADLGAILDQLLRTLRDVLVVKTCGPEAELIDPFGPDRKGLEAAAANLSVPALVASLGYLTEARSRARWAADGRPIAELAIVRMASLAEMQPLPEVLGRLESLASRLAAGSAAPEDEKKKTGSSLSAKALPGKTAAPGADDAGRVVSTAAEAVSAAEAEAPPVDRPPVGLPTEAVEAEAVMARSAAKRKGLDDAMRDPLVRKVVDTFGGRIVRIDE